jgi:hypothetical protein
MQLHPFEPESMDLLLWVLYPQWYRATVVDNDKNLFFPIVGVVELTISFVTPPLPIGPFTFVVSRSRHPVY